MAPRRGTTNSKTRARLIAAAERVLTEDGFHAISARRIAEKADLKPQLVHYYFETMDDLIVAVHQKTFEQDVELHKQALADAQPLRALWKLYSNRPDTKRMLEFIAVGTHRVGVRSSIIDAAEKIRSLQVSAVEQSLERHGVDRNLYSAEAMVMLMTAAARTLVTEASMGVSAGHGELRRYIEALLDRLEPLPAAPEA